MKIVYVCREFPPSVRGGGIATYNQIIAKAMSDAGNEVHIICASDDTRIDCCNVFDGVTVHRLSGGDFWINKVEPSKNPFRKFRYAYRFWSYRKKILRKVRELTNVDIIEVPEYGAEGYYLLRHSRIPVVVRLHTPTLLNHRNFALLPFSIKCIHKYYFGISELKIVREAKYVSSCSTPLKEWFEKYANPPAKIKVIYNPINVKEFLFKNHVAVKINANTPQQSSKRTILFAGTICDWKGVGDLYNACCLLRNRGWDFTLILAGKIGSYAQKLTNAANGASWITLTGKIERDNLFDLYKSASVICFPSWWENMPMVCLEAMANGGVVIGSSHGGMSEIINDGIDGFLLEPQNPSVWSNKIEDVFNMPDGMRIEISNNAINKIVNKFSVEIISKQMENYYHSVIRDFKAS